MSGDVHVQFCERLWGRFPRATHLVVMCKSISQAEKALDLVKCILEQDLGLQLNTDKTKISRCTQGFEFLGFRISSFSVRMRAKSEENFKSKVRKLSQRSHNLDATAIEKLNRVIRGTVNFFHPHFATNLSQFSRLDKWIRKRIRCLKFKRIWHSDNYRMKNLHLRRLGLLSCRELCLAVKER